MRHFLREIDEKCRNGYDSNEDEDDLSTNDNHEQNDEESCPATPEPVVTPGEFLLCLDKIRTFAQSHGASDDIHKALSDLEALGVLKN